MELVEPIERINKFLVDQFGIYEDGRPKFRVVFSEGLIEKRILTHTKDGFELLTPIVEEIPKYQHIKDRYVLEQLSIVPDGVESDLTERLTYEPLWTFEDRHGKYLPPRIDVCKLIIEQIYVNMGVMPRKYTEDPEKEAKELAKVEEYLFGDETEVTDALHWNQAVTVPELPSDMPKSETVKTTESEKIH